MKKRISKLITLVISLILINCVIWTNTNTGSVSANKRVVNQENVNTANTTVPIPGELSEKNNVVFTKDGGKGLVAAFKEQDGATGHSVYSFNTLTGEVIDRLDTLNFSLVTPTKLTISNDDVLVISALSSLPDEVDFIIVPINADGSFARDRQVNLAFRVPVTEDEQILPNEISLSADGSYGIYSNKTNIFVFSTTSGQIISSKQIVLEGDLGKSNRIESFTYDQQNGHLALIHQQNGQYFILVYTLALDGQLQLERRIRLPKREVIGYGSKLAFDELGTKVYLVSSNLGQLSAYDIASANLVFSRK